MRETPRDYEALRHVVKFIVVFVCCNVFISNSSASPSCCCFCCYCSSSSSLLSCRVASKTRFARATNALLTLPMLFFVFVVAAVAFVESLLLLVYFTCFILMVHT